MSTYVIPSNPNANAQIAQGIAQLGMALAGGDPEAQAKARLIRDQMMTGAAEREKLALETQILTGKKGVLDAVGKESVPTVQDAEGRTVVDPNYLGKALSNQIILTDGAADPSRWQGTVNASVEDELARKRALEDDQRKFEQTRALERDKIVSGAPGEQLYGRDPATGVLTDPRTGQPIAQPSPTAIPSMDRGTNGDGFPNRDLNAPLDDALPTDPSPAESGLLPGDSKLGSALGAAPGPVVIPLKKGSENMSATEFRAARQDQADLQSVQDSIKKLEDLKSQSATAANPLLGVPVVGGVVNKLTQALGTEGAKARLPRAAVAIQEWLNLSQQLKGAITEAEGERLAKGIPDDGASAEVWNSWIDQALATGRRAEKAVKTRMQSMNDAAGKTTPSSLGSALGSSPSPTPSPTPAPSTAPTPPPVGFQQDGYEFTGGNPADPSNWRKLP